MKTIPSSTVVTIMKFKRALVASVFLIGSSSMVFGVIPSEKIIMDKAREAYGKGQMDSALNEYNKISEKSDYWIEALEEKAWVDLRSDQPSKALAKVTTLTSELLAPQVGPEVYYLKALINYKLCNIKGIYNDIKFFKKRMEPRSESLKALIKGQIDPKLQDKISRTLQKYQSKPQQLKADHFGRDMQALPRYFYRDPQLLSASRNHLKGLMSERLKALANDDNAEIIQNLKKMNLLETQVVQQVTAYQDEMKKKRKAEFRKLQSDDDLIFTLPDQNDPWLDEIDKIEAATTNCPIDPLKGTRG